MATLVSPGVSVQISDESAYIPASATTVPLIFIATAAEKRQPNGDPAIGTYEHSIVRLVTSVTQSTQLYGVPVFLEDDDGRPLHGDARNEYGLQALNNFLSAGRRAYVVRVNINTDDSRESRDKMWRAKTAYDQPPYGAAYLVEIGIRQFLDTYNDTNGFRPGDPEYRTRVDGNELMSIVDDAFEEVFGIEVVGNNVYFKDPTFRTVRRILLSDQRANPLDVYGNGFNQPPTNIFTGVEGMVGDNEFNEDGQGWTQITGRRLVLSAVETIMNTVEYINATTLGATDADRRSAIVEAMQKEILNNFTVRSPAIEYTLIAAPGYFEVVDEMVSLNSEIGNEAFVIGDVPFNMNPMEIRTWATTPQRQRSEYLAYYYPHAIGSNLDGKEVFYPSSSVALRTIATSDSLSYVWFAPAGLNRGRVMGATTVGYLSGTLGEATTFLEAHLSVGERDALYEFDVNINPINFETGHGLVVWGQKTSASTSSAMDRINVARLIAYIARNLRKQSRTFVFQPNDQLTRDNWKAMADNFLLGIMSKRGLYDYGTQSDSSNNTPDVIDRNEMYLNVVVAPTKTAEFLYIPLRVVNTGEV